MRRELRLAGGNRRTSLIPVDGKLNRPIWYRCDIANLLRPPKIWSIIIQEALTRSVRGHGSFCQVKGPRPPEYDVPVYFCPVHGIAPCSDCSPRVYLETIVLEDEESCVFHFIPLARRLPLKRNQFSFRPSGNRPHL